MSNFQRIGNVIENKGKPAQPSEPVRPQPAFRYAAEDDEQRARSEIKLRELAGKPLVIGGRAIYQCSACHDMKFLRADVPLGHRLFGKARLCPCHPQFERFGAEWFAFGPGSD